MKRHRKPAKHGGLVGSLVPQLLYTYCCALKSQVCLPSHDAEETIFFVSYVAVKNAILVK